MHPHPPLRAKVEDGFYVGSRAGQFLGYVDQENGDSFIARNMYSKIIGEFPSLSDAQQAVEHGPAEHGSGDAESLKAGN